MGLKIKLKLMVVKKGKYGKHFLKISFNTDDNLPLNKPLKLHR